MKKGICILIALTMIFSMAAPCYASEMETADPVSETVGSVNQDTCTHVYGPWGNLENGHCRTCSICGVVESMGHSGPEGTITKQPTCTEEGEKVTYCTICGLEMKISISNYGHSYRYERLDAVNHNDVLKMMNLLLIFDLHVANNLLLQHLKHSSPLVNGVFRCLPKIKPRAV